MAANGCESFMAKWAEFNENTEMDPTDVVWSEFWQSPSYGLARLGKYGPAASAQQLAANINRFFAEDNYDEQLTPQETDFIWALYLRANTPVPDDVLITCNVLNHIVNTPTDQLATINWNIFDGTVSGSEEESSDEEDFVPVTNILIPPSQQLLQPFPQQTVFPPQATAPVLSAPATGFNPATTSSLLPGAPLTNPLPPPAALFQTQVPGALLQPTQTSAAEQHDLPYVTTVIKGLKSSDKSRVLMINIDDDGAGNKIQIGVFITAGELPATIINTTFSTDDYSPQDKAQKSQIHEQNKRVISAATGLIPFNLSNGVDEKGVCGQLIRGFSVVSEGKMDQDCKPGANRPRSINRDASAPISGPSAFGVPTGPTTTFPTQPGLGQAVAGQTQFGSQPTSGGFTTPPTSGGFAAAPEVAPPGTRSIQVPDFDKAGTFREAFQIPGGPHPIAVGKKVGVSPGTWYWYQLPNGAVVKSERRYLGLLDEKSMTKKHGDKQLIRVNEILRMMQGQYGPNFNQVTGAPTSTGPAPAKSSGRGKGKGKTATPPTSGGFQPMGNVFQMQATATPPSAFGQATALPAGFQAALPLPAGFQPAGTPSLPPTGTIPGVLQQAAFGQPTVAQPAPVQSLFGAQPTGTVSPMAFFGTPQAAPTPIIQPTPPQPAPVTPQAPPATNSLFASLMQTQAQTTPLPTGLFGQSTLFPPSK